MRNYILSQWPFLQLLNADNTNLREPSTIQTSLTFTILDYHSALASSRGTHQFSGTIQSIAINTAAKMVDIAKEREWPIVHFVNGSRLMKRAGWIRAEMLKLNYSGFTPTKTDWQIFKIIHQSAADKASFIPYPG